MRAFREPGDLLAQRQRTTESIDAEKRQNSQSFEGGAAVLLIPAKGSVGGSVWAGVWRVALTMSSTCFAAAIDADDVMISESLSIDIDHQTLTGVLCFLSASQCEPKAAGAGVALFLESLFVRPSCQPQVR
jgi:hypothetical protein